MSLENPFSIKEALEELSLRTNTTTTSEALGLDSLPPSFKKEIIRASKHLKEHGWAVVKDVLSPQECDSLLEEIWDLLDQISKKEERALDNDGDNRYPLSSNVKDFWYYPFTKLLPHTKGIVNSHRFNWLLPFRKIRQHPNVLLVFASLFGSLQLYPSADRVNLQFPGKKYVAQAPWAHVDQDPTNLKKRGLCSIQSYLTLHDVNEHSPGNRFHDKSHLFFDQWESSLPEGSLSDIHGVNWFKIDGHPERMALLEKHKDSYPLVKPQHPKGSLLLWDSRTVHSPMSLHPKASKADMVRLVCYLCYLPYDPKIHTDKMLEKKEKALSEFWSTRHLPLPQTKFGDTIRTYGKDDPLYATISKEFLMSGPISLDEALLFHHLPYSKDRHLLGNTSAWSSKPLVQLFDPSGIVKTPKRRHTDTTTTTKRKRKDNPEKIRPEGHSSSSSAITTSNPNKKTRKGL